MARQSRSILREYDGQVELYSSFAEKTRNLVTELLAEARIRVHSVTARVKTREGLENKLSKPGASYARIGDVTDIAGVRIITYFADEVDEVSELIEREFKIDWENSIDKRSILDPDRFGYVSLHHVASLSPKRAKLSEYKRFEHLKVEMQTRSILQHTWAEIEHDLGYKSKLAIPRQVQRQFSRLAGLLELADQEFQSIRDSLSNYSKFVANQIADRREDVPIDGVTLAAFITEDPLVHKLDLDIVKACQGSVKKPNLASIEAYIDPLRSFGIKSIGELRKSLKDSYNLVFQFAHLWLGGTKPYAFDAGISVFYLVYVLAAQTQKRDRIREFIVRNKLGIGTPDEITDDIVETYNRALEQSRAGKK